MMDNFKSPVKKLNAFFKNSRDKWKEKCKHAMLEIRSQNKRIEFLETSKAEVKSQLKKLKEENRKLQNDFRQFENSKKKINNIGFE